LIAVGLIGGIGYMVKTGKTQSVLSSARNAGSRIKTTATTRMKSAGFSAFTNSNYEHGDKNPVVAEPEYHGEDDSYS
jgi:hypothetical protein